jgi:hypothetical protein
MLGRRKASWEAEPKHHRRRMLLLTCSGFNFHMKVWWCIKHVYVQWKSVSRTTLGTRASWFNIHDLYSIFCSLRCISFLIVLPNFLQCTYLICDIGMCHVVENIQNNFRHRRSFQMVSTLLRIRRLLISKYVCRRVIVTFFRSFHWSLQTDRDISIHRAWRFISIYFTIKHS